ncbi:MAG: hypothetical protein IPM96_16160, partial [Ignavibacteria bacterium]|nr:hypothetical protein [Ignavibacteria bacterium]
ITCPDIFISVNLLLTIGIASSGDSAFTYDADEISVMDLKMFARFPQGTAAGY